MLRSERFALLLHRFALQPHRFSVRVQRRFSVGLDPRTLNNVRFFRTFHAGDLELELSDSGLELRQQLLFLRLEHPYFERQIVYDLNVAVVLVLRVVSAVLHHDALVLLDFLVHLSVQVGVALLRLVQLQSQLSNLLFGLLQCGLVLERISPLCIDG